MTVLPVSKQLFPQSALFEHRGVQHLLLLEARHTIRPSPVVNLLRETYHEVVLLTTAQRDARVASPDRKIKVRRFDLQATLGGAVRASRQHGQKGSQWPHKQARHQMSRVQPCVASATISAAPAKLCVHASTARIPSSRALPYALMGMRAPFGSTRRVSRALWSRGLASDADASGRSRANARISGAVLSRDEVIALLAGVLVLAGGRQRTVTTATLAIGFSLVVASFAAFAAAALVPDWLTLVEFEIATTAMGWGSFTGAAFVLLSLSPAPAHRARVQYMAVSFGAFLGTAWVLLGDVAYLRALVAPGHVPDWAVIDPPNARYFAIFQIAQELIYTVTWCVGSFALVALAIASRCTRRVSTKLLLTALWAHLGGASLFLAINRAVTTLLDAFSGSVVYADANLSRPLLVLNLVASVFLLAQAIATQFVGFRHRLVRLIALVCCSASGAEASLAPLLGFGSRYGERAPDDVCAEAEHAFRPLIALMTVLPVSKQLFPQSALFEHRGEQHLLLLEERHAVKVSPVVNLLRETYHEVVLLTTAQRDARVASPDRKIKVRRFDLQATLGGAAHSSRRRQQHGPRSKAGQQALRVQPCSLSTPAPVALAEPRAPRQSGAQPSTAGAACSPVSLAWVGARIPFRTGRASDTLASDSGANDRARVHAREIDPVFSRVEVIALLADVLVLAGGRQRTITTATLAIGFSLVAASFAAFAAAELVPDWLTPAVLVFARTLTASSSFTGAAFVLLSLSPAAAYRARLQLVAISFGAILGSAWVLIGDVTILRTLVAPGYVSEWAVIDPSNTRFFVAYRIAQALLYLATWCIASFALVALALASICIRRVSTRFLLSALWAHLGGASLSFAIHRAVSSPLNAFSGVWVHADAETGRLFLVISVVASVSLLAQAIATQFVGIRHRLVRLIARVCCSASGAEASLAPLLGFGSRYGERAPDDVYR
ncbi:hypothetical protein KFE25_010355 [Diacronema lutheri]|uniref:Uncharacterized protein n=1 Tax=Diacronema lutheri TaxID=2081491 RepID=A0A8J6CAE8_DIALT|nr:hypothetical protein KFE25_010355 [Diacronema lutheri]